MATVPASNGTCPLLVLPASSMRPRESTGAVGWHHGFRHATAIKTTGGGLEPRGTCDHFSQVLVHRYWFTGIGRRIPIEQDHANPLINDNDSIAGDDTDDPGRSSNRGTLL